MELEAPPGGHGADRRGVATQQFGAELRIDAARDDQLGLAKARRRLAMVYRTRRDIRGMEAELERAIAHARAAGDSREEARSLGLLATAAFLGPTPAAEGIERCSRIRGEARGNSILEKQKIEQQTLPQGPAASQAAIKVLGINGGGFFNANAAHPYENPTPLANFFQMLAILLIPGGLTYYLGRMVKNQKHGWAVWSAMTAEFLLKRYLDQAPGH